MFDVTPPSAQKHPASRGRGAAEGEDTGMRRGQRSCPEQAPAAWSYSLRYVLEPAVHVFTPLHTAVSSCLSTPCHSTADASLGQRFSRGPSRRGRPRTSPPTWEVSVFSTTHTFLIKFSSVTTLLWFAGDESWLKEIARVDVKEWTNSLSM